MTTRTPYWWEAIDAAEKRGGFTEEDVERAEGWVDCACGKQDPRIPRHHGLAPKDYRLATLGVHFYDAVDGNLYEEARRILLAIEKRAAEVIADVEEGR